MSETKTQTATAVDFDLTPPDPVPAIAPEKAAGLVPVTDEVKSKLETKVDGFVADLIAQDSNSPEFGKKVDQLTNMGRSILPWARPGAAAAGGLSHDEVGQLAVASGRRARERPCAVRNRLWPVGPAAHRHLQ